MRLSAVPASALTLVVLGRVHFQSRPIAPDAALAAFSARTLDDPGLRRFLEANHAAPPDQSFPGDWRR